MKNEIEFLKAAAGHTPVPTLLSCYVVHDNMLYTDNGAMAAGVPFQFNGSMLIPTEALELAVARMTDKIKVVKREQFLVITSGRLRNTIALINDDSPPHPDMNGEWEPCPAGFAEALKLAIPFASDEQNWKSGISIHGERVKAMDGYAGIDIVLEDGDLPNVLISKDTASFIADHAPDEYCTTNGGLAFRWEDGRWMTTRTLVYEMPHAQINGIFSKAGTDAPIPVTEEWREAFGDIASMTSEVVELRPDRLIGRKENSIAEAAVKTGLPSEHRSFWTNKVMSKVLSVAQAWNPDQWPNPTFFKGPNFRGVCMGSKG